MSTTTISAATTRPTPPTTSPSLATAAAINTDDDAPALLPARIPAASPEPEATAAAEGPPASAASSPTEETPTSVTDRDVEDGKSFVSSRAHLTPRCRAHAPTLEELQKKSFSEYIRQVVLESARVIYEDEVKPQDDAEEVSYIEDIEMNQKGYPTKPPRYSEGMVKVTLPKGFWKEEGIGQDRTGRGPAWQKGTPLGDKIVQNPIKQCVRGIGGVYEYTLMDQPSVTVHEFREKADLYQQEQLLGTNRSPKKKKNGKKTTKNQNSSAVDEFNSEANEPKNNNSDNNDSSSDDGSGAPKLPTVEEMERKFWKRLGPTMPPAVYGADMEGSMFGDDPACGWNLGQLDSFLMLLGPNLPGVTSPYLYFGMWASVFAVHTEDMNLLSINYLHAGAPKIWYAVAPGPDAKRLEALTEHYFSHAHKDCKEFLRHKRYMLSPMILKKAGIKYTMQVQYPGDAMITIPGGYHFGFNAGFNVAEATNFGVPEWIPYGHEARICMCRPDSVRIDMFRLERLLVRYNRENKKKTKRRRKSYRDWGIAHFEAHNKQRRQVSDSETESDSEDDEHDKKSKKNRLKDFWVEVMAPVPSSQRADYGRRGTSTAVKAAPKPSPKTNSNSKVMPKKRPAERWGFCKEKVKRAPRHKEIWHLAKPMTRKGLVLGAKVLVMIPGIVAGANSCDDSSSSSDSSDTEQSSGEEDEQCFAGEISEFQDDWARIHFAGLQKEDDVWMQVDSNKLFLDGGTWDETHEIKGVPPRHYWQEMDSKRRCS